MERTPICHLFPPSRFLGRVQGQPIPNINQNRISDPVCELLLLANLVDPRGLSESAPGLDTVDYAFWDNSVSFVPSLSNPCTGIPYCVERH